MAWLAITVLGVGHRKPLIKSKGNGSKTVGSGTTAVKTVFLGWKALVGVKHVGHSSIMASLSAP